MSWGLVAVAGATLVGGALASDAAGDAADSQAESAGNSLALQERMFNKQVELQQPFYDNGLAAQNKLAGLITGGGLNTQFQFDANDLYNDPSYAFRQQQGQQAVERSASARGMTNSGAQLKALNRYGQDYASTEYGNAYNRAQNTFNQNLNNQLNPLQSLAGQGQTTAGNIGQAASNYATSAGNTITGLGNAQAASQIAGGNALSGSLSGAANAYSQNQLLSQLMGQSGQAAWNNSYLSGGGGFGTGASFGNQDYGAFI